MIQKADGSHGPGNSPKTNWSNMQQDGLGVRDRLSGFAKLPQDFVEHFNPDGKERDILINRYLATGALIVSLVSVVIQWL